MSKPAMLEDKVILITGSSRGIGLASARLAAKKYGAKVVLHGKTESDHLKSRAKEIDCPYIFCDAAAQDQVFAAVEKAAGLYGRIDGLLNCAGIFPEASFANIDRDNFYAMFDTNVLGTIFFSQACAKEMAKRKSGRIVNVSSIRAFAAGASARSPLYAMSKAAINALTVTMAKELAKDGIAVNAIAPGLTETETHHKSSSPDVQAQVPSIPLGRVARPDEIAEVALFLLSDRASYITGEIIITDGGALLAGK
jgi:3-oxoacyl-[acyl-carrier protein] reductase